MVTKIAVDNEIIELTGEEEAALLAELKAQDESDLDKRVRFQRDVILKNEVDPIVTNPLRWEGLTTEQQDAMKSYRTELLNLPQQEGFPHNITWPEKPVL